MDPRIDTISYSEQLILDFLKIVRGTVGSEDRVFYLKFSHIYRTKRVVDTRTFQRTFSLVENFTYFERRIFLGTLIRKTFRFVEGHYIFYDDGGGG